MIGGRNTLQRKQGGTGRASLEREGGVERRKQEARREGVGKQFGCGDRWAYENQGEVRVGKYVETCVQR